MLGAVFFGLLIGLVMGMVGGGGAVLAVPALVYVVGLGVREATTVSLAVVAMAAVTGTIGQARRGAVCWTSAAWLSAAAVLGGFVGAAVNRALGGAVLLLIFSGVMLIAARATWQRAGTAVSVAQGCPEAAVGVGGGFASRRAGSADPSPCWWRWWPSEWRRPPWPASGCDDRDQETESAGIQLYDCLFVKG